MNETTENFWKIFSNLEPWSPPKIFWRLYHDDAGFPLFYTMEDKPGNYIDVTPEQYQRSNMRVRVKDGKLIELNANPVKKIVPSEYGTTCDPLDVAVVVSAEEPHQCWRTKTNESN